MNKLFYFTGCLACIMAGAFLSWFLIYKAEKKMDKEKCIATAVLYYKDIRANIELDFMYNLPAKTGVLSVNGIYYKNGEKVGAMRKDVSYKWTENKDNFTFTSLRVDDIISNKNITTDMISNTLPDFYYLPNETISYSVVRQGSKGFLFSVGKRPVFICSR